jgi:hypothetical protein
MEGAKKLKPTVERKLVSREGIDLSTDSDYEFHKDVMEEDRDDHTNNHRE